MPDQPKTFRPLAESVAAEMERKEEERERLKERVKETLANAGVLRTSRFPSLRQEGAMAETGSSVYDYSPAQAAMIRLYELRLDALISRRYHGTKLAQASRRIAWAEIVAALSSSAAVASLAAMGWGPGIWLYGALALAAACASVYRTAFRLTERADRHARLATAWSEVFLDIDRLLGVIRREEKLSSTRMAQIDDLEMRFHRIEMMDESAPDSELHERCQKEAMQALPTDRNWLPSE